MSKKQIAKLLGLIDEKKEALAKARDELRVLHSDLEDLLNELDWCVGDIGSGCQLIGDAIDKISETI